jgi:hypothetical protein
VFVFGLCNDELGYLMLPEYFEDNAYAYERSMSPGPRALPAIREALDLLVAEVPGRARRVKRRHPKGGTA